MLKDGNRTKRISGDNFYQTYERTPASLLKGFYIFLNLLQPTDFLYLRRRLLYISGLTPLEKHRIRWKFYRENKACSGIIFVPVF